MQFYSKKCFCDICCSFFFVIICTQVWRDFYYSRVLPSKHSDHDDDNRDDVKARCSLAPTITHGKFVNTRKNRHKYYTIILFRHFVNGIANNVVVIKSYVRIIKTVWVYINYALYYRSMYGTEMREMQLWKMQLITDLLNHRLGRQ